VALIGDVAHELRTPLATIEGYTEGLLDGVVAPGAETWALLHDEVGRLRRLVQDLQELSRAEARQLPLHMRPCHPAELVDQAVAQIAPQFAEKGIVLTSDVPADLTTVQADGDRIVQVLINLLGNALRYTPEGGAVCVSAEREDGAVAFHVADTGIGIAPEHLPQLFERFYRVDKARSRALGGSGIGLTIAKAIKAQRFLSRSPSLPDSIPADLAGSLSEGRVNNPPTRQYLKPCGNDWRFLTRANPKAAFASPPVLDNLYITVRQMMCCPRSKRAIVGDGALERKTGRRSATAAATCPIKKRLRWGSRSRDKSRLLP
jgi:hypothetical protein